MVTILDDDIFFGNTFPEWDISKGFDLPWPFSYIELSTVRQPMDIFVRSKFKDYQRAF
jgi:hypothetical protein